MSKDWLSTAVATASGLVIAWVDTRPGWDDTGITVGSVLLCSGILGALWPRRPWLLGLAVGIWLPVWNLLQSGNAGAIAALAFALVGAYAGAALGRLVRIPGR